MKKLFLSLLIASLAFSTPVFAENEPTRGQRVVRMLHNVKNTTGTALAGVGLLIAYMEHQNFINKASLLKHVDYVRMVADFGKRDADRIWQVLHAPALQVVLAGAVIGVGALTVYECYQTIASFCKIFTPGSDATDNPGTEDNPGTDE